ncbi:unnamed protein product [Rotaria magnacalcarata]|nr:unnamed protein product [Rotaria magnacalcarata]
MMTIKRIQNLSSILPCRFEGYSIDMTACLMMYSHGVAAFSRQFTIIDAIKHFFRSIKCPWCFIGFGWFISIIAALPYLFVNSFTCSVSTVETFLPYYTLVNTFILSTMIVDICNCHVFLYVHKSSRQVRTGGQSSKVSYARDIHLLKVMIGTFTIFSVGWAPVFLTQTFRKNNYIPSAVDACCQILPSLTMSIDVVFLIYTNESVRVFLKKLFVRHPQHGQNKLVQTVLQQTLHTISNH